MTQMTPRQNRKLSIVQAPAPKLPKDLEYEVWQAMHPHPEAGYCPRKLAATDVEAARKALQYYEAMCEPVTLHAVSEWMKPLVLSVNNGPDQRGFEARVALVLQGLKGVPIGMLNEDTQTSALQTFKFFPSVSEVFEMLFERGHKMKKRRWALAEIVNNNATSE